MPRRKPKNTILPGQPGNPGRPHGATAKIRISDKVREAFEQLLAGATPHLEDWLIRTAQKHPDKALDLWVKISERFVPSLQRTEITGKDGEAFAPITINIPTFNLPKPGGTIEIGESTPTSLLASPAEVPKEIGEGNLTGLPGSMQDFLFPKPIGEGNLTGSSPGHYGDSHSAVFKPEADSQELPEHYGDCHSAVFKHGEDSQELLGETEANLDVLLDSEGSLAENSKELPVFTFLPSNLRKQAPPGYKPE